MHGMTHSGRSGSRGRAQRGDVRVAILILLAEQPMHGYQLMQAMADRTQGAWRPSAGAIYPTLAALKEAGLVSVQATDGRKLASLTEKGETYVRDNRTNFADPFEPLIAESGGEHDLRGPLDEIRATTRLLARSGSDQQIQAAREILIDSLRSLNSILAKLGTAGAMPPAAAMAPAGALSGPAGRDAEAGLGLGGAVAAQFAETGPVSQW
jgi:DNA-binding PadR family transcriptional regulator